jgi:hypothetical protein
MGEINVRKMLPARRNELPVFEISLDGDVIGLVAQTALRGAVNVFYRAWGIYPETTRRIDLQLSIDRDQQIETVRRFHENPQEFERHLPRDLKQSLGTGLQSAGPTQSAIGVNAATGLLRSNAEPRGESRNGIIAGS